MVHLFRFEVSFEEGSLEPVAKLYLLILDHRTLERRALEVLESLDSTIVLASTDVLPFDTNPNLLIIFGTLMFELAYISDDTGTVVEKDSSGDKVLEVVALDVEFLESFGLRLEIVVLLLLGLGLLGLKLGHCRDVLGLGCVLESLRLLRSEVLG